MSSSGNHNHQIAANSAGSESSSLLEESVVGPTPGKMKLTSGCWKSDRKIQLDVSTLFFGISAWLSINGMYTQLPVLVQSAPEGWSLPSYLSILIQGANVAPFLYHFKKKHFPQLISDSKLIYLTLIMGSTSLMFMGLYYDHTWVVNGARHSMVLFINAFFIAVVGCTSSLLFLPFMSNYPEMYLCTYMIGEGLGGLVPSFIALGQGVGGNPSCVNSTSPDGEVVTVPYTPPPRFSSEVFFFILFSLMVASTISFFLMNNLPSCKMQKLRQPARKQSTNSPVTPVELFTEPDAFTPSSSRPHVDVISPFIFKMYLFLTTVLSMVANGALPSIQSYSCLPYGNTAYHLAVNVGNIANPVACYLAALVPHTNPECVFSLTALSSISIVIVVITAVMSPSPPLQHSNWGVLIIVLSWVVCSGLISYVKMSIMLRFRKKDDGIYRYGIMTQVGAAIGSLVMFYLINYQHIFTSYNPCR